MKLLVWGTGNMAEHLLSPMKDIMDNAIEAFVDNNLDKVGNYFLGKKIISPMDIEKNSFDKILILNSYESEIRKQIIDELFIDESKILGIDDF